MDQRFSVFLLEKFRLQLQRGTRPIFEAEIYREKVLSPSKSRQLISHIVTWILAFPKLQKKKDSILRHTKRTTRQSYSG